MGSSYGNANWPQRADGSLGWFYPVYLNRRRDSIRNRTLWDPSVNEAVTEMQRLG